MNATLAPRPLTVESSLFARLAVAAGAARVLVRDPSRLDQVLVFMQAVNLGSIRRRIREIDAMPGAQVLLREQPRIDARHVDYDALERLPDGTLGREYVRFLRTNGITPEPFEKLPEIGDARAAYLVLRLRQTHDLWHVVTGYGPDVQGEILLQAFTFAQMRAPGSALIAIFGSLRYARKIAGHARALWRAYRRGKTAKPFAPFAWEEHFATPVTEVRAMLACAPA
jgi:ubiquinone biosynthesis protein COQ4